MFVVLEDSRHTRQVVSAFDPLENDWRETAGAKNLDALRLLRWG
jgi:hypothetical protein